MIKNILKKSTQISLLICTALIASSQQAQASDYSMSQCKNDEHLIFGFYRAVCTKHEVPIKDIYGIIHLYYTDVITWRLPKSEINNKLNEDFTTIYGPEYYVNGYKFIFKAKRSRGNLYLGAWYQCNEVIQTAIHAHFESEYSTPIADKIVKSFNFIITEEEFDDLPLILHDMSAPEYSCILEHVEEALRDSLLLSSYGNINTSINYIKKNIIRISSLYNPDIDPKTQSSGPEARSFFFNLFFNENETGRHFSKLYRFDTHQVQEKGAEVHWRNKYNGNEDYDLDFNSFIQDIEQLYITAQIKIIDPKYLQDDAQQEDKYAKNEYTIEGLLESDKICNMREGQHIDLVNQRYLFYDPKEEFGIRIYMRFGQYSIFLFPKFINHRKRKENKGYMDFEIDEIVMEVDGIQYGKNVNVKINEEDNVFLIGKFGTHVFLKDGGDVGEYESRTIIVSLKGIR